MKTFTLLLPVLAALATAGKVDECAVSLADRILPDLLLTIRNRAAAFLKPSHRPDVHPAIACASAAPTLSSRASSNAVLAAKMAAMVS